MDFNLFLDFDLKHSQDILDQYYPGHRIFHAINQAGTKTVMISGPDLRIIISKGV